MLAILLLISCVHAQDASKLTGELQAIDRRIELDYVTGKADSILLFYGPTFTYLPEFRPVIVETGDLQRFYTDWFRSVQIKSYKKEIYEVQNIAGYVLEIGNFTLHYSHSRTADGLYTGKYMIMWKRDSSGQLKILSEAFGSDKHIDPEDIPYAAVEVPEKRVLDKNILSPKLQPELEGFDNNAVKDIFAGNGEGRASEFTQDGIYMPHFDPMQIGMDMIRPYMVKTYVPNVITSVRDTFCEIFDTGDFVFLSGHFKVSFDNGTNKGTFEGNMSNLMKRGKDGKLLLYRQLAHN